MNKTAVKVKEAYRCFCNYATKLSTQISAMSAGDFKMKWTCKEPMGQVVCPFPPSICCCFLLVFAHYLPSLLAIKYHSSQDPHQSQHPP